MDDVSTAARAAADLGQGSDEARLVADAIAERTAFGLIYERYRLPVYRYLRALGADDELAADLVATSFERALRSLTGYRGSGGGLTAWLLRIARNTYLNERRRSARLVPLDSAMGMAAPEASARTTELRELITQLPASTRDAIALRYGAGLTAREIGLVLGKRSDAVQKLIERGLATLKEALHDVA